jgi:hypothetical protein
MWLETSDLAMVNLDHYSWLHVVPGGNAVEVRAYHGMQRENNCVLASFTGEGAKDKAESYFHSLRIFMARGRRVTHNKEFHL